MHEFELSRLSLFVYEALAGSTFGLRQEAGASIPAAHVEPLRARTKVHVGH